MKTLLRSVKTVNEALDYPSLTILEKALGEEVVLTLAITEVLKGLSAFNVKNNMSDLQVEIFIDDFMDMYKHESLADLKLCLKNARLGVYGTHYNSIDQLTIMNWFKQYLAEKADARQKRHEKEKSKRPEQLDSIDQIAIDQMKKALTDEQEQ